MNLKVLIIALISFMNLFKSFQLHYKYTSLIHNRLNKQNKQMALFSSSMNSNYKRPSLDDIERISKGQAAKSRGVGSRQVPHRLNTVCFFVIYINDKVSALLMDI